MAEIEFDDVPPVSEEVASDETPKKRKRGRPLGSKKKKDVTVSDDESSLLHGFLAKQYIKHVVKKTLQKQLTKSQFPSSGEVQNTTYYDDYYDYSDSNTDALYYDNGGYDADDEVEYEDEKVYDSGNVVDEENNENKENVPPSRDSFEKHVSFSKNSHASRADYLYEMMMNGR